MLYTHTASLGCDFLRSGWGWLRRVDDAKQCIIPKLMSAPLFKVAYYTNWCNTCSIVSIWPQIEIKWDSKIDCGNVLPPKANYHVVWNYCLADWCAQMMTKLVEKPQSSWYEERRCEVEDWGRGPQKSRVSCFHIWILCDTKIFCFLHTEWCRPISSAWMKDITSSILNCTN